MTTTAAWILDASVAAKWYLRDEQFFDQADRILDQLGEGIIGLAAPVYLLDEAGNILRTGVRRGRLSNEQGVRAYASFLRLEVTSSKRPLSGVPRRSHLLWNTTLPTTMPCISKSRWNCVRRCSPQIDPSSNGLPTPFRPRPFSATYNPPRSATRSSSRVAPSARWSAALPTARTGRGAGMGLRI